MGKYKTKPAHSVCFEELLRNEVSSRVSPRKPTLNARLDVPEHQVFFGNPKLRILLEWQPFLPYLCLTTIGQLTVLLLLSKPSVPVEALPASQLHSRSLDVGQRPSSVDLSIASL